MCPQSQQIPGMSTTVSAQSVDQTGPKPRRREARDIGHSFLGEAISDSSVFLPMGALYCSRDPAIVTTVLGSCVSVCLWDRRLAMSGINHFLLPRWSGEQEPSLKYGDIAIESLLAEMTALGSRRSDLVAKVFGGAALNTLPGTGVGNGNIAFALDHLRHHGIEMVAKRTGGTTGVHLRLFTGTGMVQVRPVEVAPFDWTEACAACETGKMGTGCAECPYAASSEGHRFQT